MGLQYLRKSSLVVSDGSSDLDLSQLRIEFDVQQYDISTPMHANIRVYNLSRDTAKRIEQEFTQVTLQAGYQDAQYGIIFAGTIIQVRRGRVDPVDTYTDIVAADGDLGYNFAFANKTIQGASPDDQLQELYRVMGVKSGYTSQLPQKNLPRGKVLFGMASDRMRDLSTDVNARQSFNGGGFSQLLKITDVVPGDAVVLNAQTGMIGLPEQTEDGIHIQSLLNPNYKVGGQVKVDNASIQKFTVDPSLQGQTDATQIAQMLDADGQYKMLVIRHHGDTRGTAWYSDLICVSITGFSPSLTVKGYG